MVGGMMSGYWAAGRVTYAIAPRMTVTTEITVAKIGRSIKKCASFMIVSFVAVKRALCAVPGLLAGDLMSTG
jgi:hypothetical protein